ncbi:tetratricopeptide repeat protein [Odoribacter lunatus]|uniref:tetratricopeptide repeat protein n=1 Tax=Odoribacter lunatus TaxID=2941335 RepID=UPI00203EFCF0|nr:tetratricopeptide repeat protein [Odoribacter lunatus]
MKKLLLILPFILWTLLGAAQPLDLPLEAEVFYREGKYEDAANTYAKILSAGMESARLYYNLGNCYYKLGENTKAILNYERSLLLNPGDADARYNLKMAQEQIVDKIEVLPEIFFLRWYKALVTYFSADQWAYISLGWFLVFLGMLALFFYSARSFWKKIGFTVGIIALFFTVMSVIFTVKQNHRFTEREYGIIMTPSVTVKGAPDNSGTDLFLIHEGLKVHIVGTLGDWVNIRLVDGNEGWIAKKDVEKI